ncbi:MAG: hypothetical protein QM687_02130 [Ferruginibacter sp.]
MKKIILFTIAAVLTGLQPLHAQDCQTNADLDASPGKYLTAAQYPWPAVRAEYFRNLVTAADKAQAKQTLVYIENEEQKSHDALKLTGGNWENYYSTDGYSYLGAARAGKYYFQSALHEFFCFKGKLKRNDEASTILRVYVNSIPLNTLNRFLQNPFGSSLGEYDFGLQFLDWKNHKPADVNAQLISLFSFLSCNNETLLRAINTGNGFFQDVPEKEIKPNNRNTSIYRYWFVKKNNTPLLVPVSRKEYLQSLLEYYEREKLYFPMLIGKLNSEHSSSVKQYSNWAADVNAKIAVVKKSLSDHDDAWLAAQAVMNYLEDKSQNYKAGLTERTNYNRFWKFYDNEKKSEGLFKYNPDYFKTGTQNPARPQIISLAFRYVPVASSIRILDNFTKNFDFEALKKILQ